jgi:hypothetical protein
MYLPSVNWTKEDGVMVGLTLHNGFLVTKPVEYFVMPFYTIGNRSLAGFGRISYNIVPYNAFVRLATLRLEGTKFGAPGLQSYYMAKTGLDVYFKPFKINQPLRQKIYGYYIAASDLFQVEVPERAKIKSFVQAGYQMEKTGLVNPYALLAAFESGASFQKTSLELKYRISYFGKENGLDLRLFTGVMLKNNSATAVYGLSPGGRSGREQYLYQEFYPDRFAVFPKSFWSRQMTLSEGGLVSPVNDSLGYSPWLLSLSLTSSLPGKACRFPIKPFATVLVNNHGLGGSQSSRLFGEAGVKVGIWNVFEIYFPILVSGNIQSISKSLRNRIRIVLNLDLVSHLKLNSQPH